VKADKIGEKLGDKYEGVFITERQCIEKLRGELRAQLGRGFTDAAVDAYIFKNMSLGGASVGSLHCF
jgi:hypothetical protein